MKVLGLAIVVATLGAVADVAIAHPVFALVVLAYTGGVISLIIRRATLA